MNANELKLLKEVLSVKGSKFISLVYRNQHHELSKYGILIGAKLINSYEKDLKTLERVQTNSADEELARQELMASIRESLEKGIGNNSRYTKVGYYEHVDDNVVVNMDEDVYLRGFVVSKTVIEEGSYPSRNSSPKTIAKNKLRKLLRMGKYREFSIPTNQIASAAINGKRIVIDASIELNNPVPKKKVNGKSK